MKARILAACLLSVVILAAVVIIAVVNGIGSTLNAKFTSINTQLR